MPSQASNSSLAAIAYPKFNRILELMMRSKIVSLTPLLILMADAFAMSSAQAQTIGAEAGPLPSFFSTTPTGAEVRTGRFIQNHTDLAIGDPTRGGLSLVRSDSLPMTGGSVAGTESPAVNYEFLDRVYQTQSGKGPSGTIYIYIHYNGTDASFATDQLYDGFIDVSGFRSGVLTRTVVGSSHYYTYQSTDGTVITFATTSGLNSDAISLTRPDGVSFQYSSGRVVSNAGYAIIHDSGGSKICVLNLANTPLPGSNVCPAGVPTTSYSYSGLSMTSFTDADGQTWNMTNTAAGIGVPFQRAYYYPGASTPYLTNYFSYDAEVGVAALLQKQVYADGRSYTYEYNYDEFGKDSPSYLVYLGDYFDQLNNKTTLGWTISRGPVDAIVPSPTIVTDPLNRQTTYTYCADFKTFCSITAPSGIKSTFSYDNWHNLGQTSVAPAPGSSLAAKITKATYDCATFAHCTKPITQTDANGNETDFTYDATSGVMLTKTGPAVNGVRPQTRYTYAQRYAWVSNGAGGYAHSFAPIWVLTQESYCKTGAPASSGTGCASGASDEVVTTYDYGPDTGPNNLLLRGKVEDSTGLALRTCYNYDYSGHKISETSPRAGLASCS